MADKLLQCTVVTFQGVSKVAAVTVSVGNTHKTTERACSHSVHANEL